MTKERLRNEDNNTHQEIDDVFDLNTANITDQEEARKKVMHRFNSGESVIQPPESSGKDMAGALKESLAKYKK